MISQLEIDKRNLESSLLFMQQEHSTTLKALHEEISKLQKKCTDLTFELTMQDNGPNSNTTEKQELAEKNMRINDLEILLTEKESACKQLEVEKKDGDDLGKELKVQIRKQNKKYLEETKKLNQQVLTLQVELSDKGCTIANLTAELHKIKVLQYNAEVRSSPPSGDQQPASRRYRRLPSASDISTRPVTAKGNANIPRPNTEIFLARSVPAEEEAETGVALKPTPPVLPPISGDDNASSKVNSRRHKVLRRRLESQPEYSKLAVDKLVSSSNSNTWVHEPSSSTK